MLRKLDLYKMVVSHCCCFSVAKSCPTLCTPMNCSMPGFPILHHPPKFAQTHVHWVSDAIQPSHPLLPTSALVFLNLFQHQDLFHWVISSHQVAKVLELQLQNQWIFSLGMTSFVSLLSERLSRVFSSTSVLKFQFFNESLLYGLTLTSIRGYWKNHSFDYMDLCWQSDVSAF